MGIRESSRNARNPTYEMVYTRALELFEQDRNKTNLWWITKQEILDNKAPYEMVKEGKARKLIRMMEKCGV